MKKLSILLSCYLISITAFGQIEWVYDNIGRDEYLHQFVKTKKGQYAILHGKTDHCCPERLTVLDSTGLVLFNFSTFAGPGSFNISSFKDIVEMPDSTISVVTHNSVYDSLSMTGFLYSAVLKLDVNWTPALIAENWDYSYDIGATLSDASYVLLAIENNSIWRKDSNGNDIWVKGLPGYDIVDLATKSNDTILIATGQGLLIIDGGGNIAAEYPSLIFDRIQTNSQDGMIGAKGDSIFLLSPDYSLLASIGYGGDNIRDFSVEGDMIAVLAESGQVFRYDGSLTFLNNFQLFNDGQFDQIAIGPEKLVLAGMEWYGGTDNDNSTRTVFVKEYSFEGNDYGISNDIGVVGVEQGAEIVVTQGSSSYSVVFKDVKVTVRNYGNHPVESLYLRSNQNRNKQFDNLILKPGEEIDLLWDDLQLSFFSNPAGLAVDLCIWTSHPDLLMDLDAENDSHCSGFLVSDEEVFIQNSIAIYPNPTSGQLNFQLRNTGLSSHSVIRFTDMNGQILRTFDNFMPNATHIIPIWDWPAGVYVLQYLEDGLVVASERFVVAK